MDKKIKEKKDVFIDLDDEESIKCAIIDARVKFNFSLIQSLFYIGRIIEKESKHTFSYEELEKISFFLLDKSGLYADKT
jgi:hypothetical protein